MAQGCTLRLANGGRIVIPAEVREKLDLKIGGEVILTVEGDHATLMSAKAARRRAQGRVRRYISSSARLSDELLAERKAEAPHE
jgi:AbrB family looped-hinge helix DNA binding protein